MRNVMALVGGYAGVSVAALGVMAAFGSDTALVPSGVWIRGSVVAAASVVTLFLALRAGRGDERMRARLRLVTTIQVVAIAVIVALPGMFPVWFRIEQALCGLLLLPVVVQLNRRRAVESASAA